MLFSQISRIFFFLMILRPPKSTLSSSSAASDVYKRQVPKRLGYLLGEDGEVGGNVVFGILATNSTLHPQLGVFGGGTHSIQPSSQLLTLACHADVVDTDTVVHPT
eukprot:TRINITY_DN12509_c0_g1_i1.p2 TRINITY_DN12509_c0_g1~~TRINITY_DN12509_c0_g1_i1.p2  ORF type:complete len:106 (+),score=6.14 TRINITY_DN12509_c0_g1_i1:2-319(+)